MRCGVRGACAVLSAHVEEALGAVPSLEGLEAVLREVWRALAAGHLSDAEADRLDGLGRARRAELQARVERGGGASPGGPVRASQALGGVVRRVRRPRSPDRAASMARRRRVAGSGAVPSDLWEHFTAGEVAVLSVVGREAARGRPFCDWPMDRIAALAGVGRTTARGALRLAERLGLVRVR